MTIDRATNPDYTLRHRADILAIVDRLHRERVFMTVEFGANHAIVTCVLEVRRDANTIVFDIARDADMNRALFAATSLSFVCELDHIPIAFSTNAATPVACSDGPAAIVVLPTSITRLQRREWFRAALPVEPPIRCTVLDPRGNASPALAIDLSCGGLGVIAGDAVLGAVAPGSGHEVIVSLPEVGRLEVEATLRTVRPAGAPVKAPDAALLGTTMRLGFRFERMPAKTANQIQRYVQQLEVTQLRVLRLRSRAA